MNKNIFQLSKYIAYFSKIHPLGVDMFMNHRDKIIHNVGFLNKHSSHRYNTNYIKLVDDIKKHNIDYINCNNQTPLLLVMNNNKILDPPTTKRLFQNGYDLNKKWKQNDIEHDIMSYRHIPRYISIFKEDPMIDILEIMCQNGLFNTLEKQLLNKDIHYFTLGYHNGIYDFPTHPRVADLYVRYDSNYVLNKEILWGGVYEWVY